MASGGGAAGGANRKNLSTAKISQVIDESRWKEKIHQERKAQDYWNSIYGPEYNQVNVTLEVALCKV